MTDRFKALKCFYCVRVEGEMKNVCGTSLMKFVENETVETVTSCSVALVSCLSLFSPKERRQCLGGLIFKHC